MMRDSMPEVLNNGSRQHLMHRLRDFSWLSEAQRAALTDSSRLFEVRRGGAIYRENQAADALYLLLSGVASLSMPVSKRRVLVGLLGPGDIVGASSLMGDEPSMLRC